MSEDSSVAVGVRIRPFNDREKKLGAILSVEMDGPSTTLLPPPEGADGPAEPFGKGSKERSGPKTFTFDASFWSFDGFEEDATGYCRPTLASKYADQQLVYETFGKKVLDNAWEGYHCCLFAYGQTGAGKSYSMVGYGANKGIVPISTEEIFRRIEANNDPGLSYEVTVSMIEIYNEQVQDLLLQPSLRPKKGLEIRESQQLGIYIDGVKKRPVASYPAIEAVMEEGTENRTVGSTLMNATSSRAHTVITIEFKQVSTLQGGTQGSKLSMINLVDLAGSEKAGQTGASGDRLKEGCAINKSLSALGNVIEKLADKATAGKGKNVVIPYRDSKLTRLLQNALGGSSKTVMICAISPASTNYEETLSTLRYADRAKRIKNTAVINENPQDKLIRQLREENNKLRDMIGTGDEKEQSEADMKAKQAEILQLEEMLKEMQRSHESALQEAQKAASRKKKEVDLTVPHIANLNEDDMLTNKLRFSFPEGAHVIGRGGGEQAPQVALAGAGIQPEHATITNKGGRCVLVAAEEAMATTFVNGASLEGKVLGIDLEHGDRIAFCQNIFVFVDPAASKGGAKELISSGTVSFELARKELAAAQGEMPGPSEEELKASRELAEELERRVREAEEAKSHARNEAEALLRKREEEFREQMEKKQQEWENEKRAAEAAKEQAAVAEQANVHAQELLRLQEEFEAKQRAAEEAAQKRIKELEKLAKKAAAEEEDHRQHELGMQRLEEQLMIVMPLVKEANLIAAELQKPHRLEPKMHCELNGSRRGNVRVMAAVTSEGVQLFEWTAETLENRVFIMRELLERVEDEGLEAVSNLALDEDPYWDPIEVERLIGVSQVLLEGLLLQVENQANARILSTEGAQAGTLKVEVHPLGSDGTLGVPDAEVVDQPEELLGTRMAILVHVQGAADLPEVLATDVRVEYDYFIDEKPHQVPAVQGFSRSPVFDYKHTFVQDPVTSRFLEYLQSKLVFRVYGRDAAAAAYAEKQAAEQAEAAQEAEAAANEEMPEAAAVKAATEEEKEDGEVSAAPPSEQLQADPSSPHNAELSSTLPIASPCSGKGAPLTLSQARRQGEEAVEAGLAGQPSNGKGSKSCAIL